jgi:predicted AAA+ superfamily ATPase
MEKQILKSIITTHKEKFLAIDKLSTRLISHEDEKKLLSKEVVLITGIRRSGKSSLLNLYYHFLSKKNKIDQANILFINFEDERFIDFTVQDFELLYQSYMELYDPKGTKYFFLDEIQSIKGWERWINRIYEFDNIKIFITGSNASLLSSDISNSLTGRNRQIRNHCFSFAEYAILRKLTFDEKSLYSGTQQIKLNRLLHEYINLGGFPEVLKTQDTDIADQYFKDIIYRDIIAKHQIRNIKEIKELALYLISNTGNLNSYANLRKIIGATNTTTIKNYIALLGDVFLIHALPLFDFSIKKQIYNSNKYYVSDIGFYHAVGFSFSPDRGRLLENIILTDLLRLNYQTYYWKSTKGYEVDFLVQKQKNNILAIQVCYHLTNENMEREVRGLISAKEELFAQELIIITMDQNSFDTAFLQESYPYIKVISYLNWLLYV